MGGQIPADDSERFFDMARNSLMHAAMQAPADSDRWILGNGLGTIATGLEILSAELKATRKQLDDVKSLLRQMQMQRR
jgi:hypothetical protein